MWWHTQGTSGRPASDLGWGSSSKTAPGSLSTGSPAGRTPPHGDGSIYTQANVRAGKVLRPIRALPSVIVDTEKVLREADGPVEKWLHTDSASGGKVFAPGCASKAGRVSRSCEPIVWAGEEPEEHKRWKNLYLIIIRSILQTRQIIHCSIIIWFTNLFLCLKPWRFPQQKQQWLKNGRNWKRFRRGTWRKSEVQRGDRWSKDEGRKSLFASRMDNLSFEEYRNGGKAPKYKGPVVLRGDIVKDDFGSYAVFTASASQMTAA